MKISGNNLIILGSILTLAILLITIAVLLFRTLRAQQRKNMYSLEWEHRQINTEQFQDYQKQYAILQNQRHDMKHHIRYIHELMEREEWEKLQEYLDSLIEDLS